MNLFTWLFGAKKPKTPIVPMFSKPVRDVKYAPTIHTHSERGNEYVTPHSLGEPREDNTTSNILTGVLIGEMLSDNNNQSDSNTLNPDNQPEQFSDYGGGDFGGGGSGGSYDAPDTSSSDSYSSDSSSYDSGSSSDSSSSFDSGSSSSDF